MNTPKNLVSILILLFSSFCMGNDILYGGIQLYGASSGIVVAIIEAIKVLITNGIRPDANYYNGIELARTDIFNEAGYDAIISLYFLNRDSCGPNTNHAEEQPGDALQGFLTFLIQETEGLVMGGRYTSLVLIYRSIMIKYVTYQNPYSFAEQVNQTRNSRTLEFHYEDRRNISSSSSMSVELGTCDSLSHNLYSGPVGAIGTSLHIGDQITSTNGQFRLIMQADCNLVLYEGSGDNRPIFATGTKRVDRKCTTMLYMTGILVVYDPETGRIYWSEGKPCSDHGCFKSMGLVFLPDGNIVLYNAQTGEAEWAAF